MLDFVPVPSNQIEKVKEIMNSQPDFIWLMKRKQSLNTRDIVEYLEKSKRLHNTVVLIKKGNDIVGVIDFQMKSPKDGVPWIGMLVIKSSFERLNYGTQAYQKFEKMARESGAKRVRIGVHVANKGGRIFWGKQGFIPYKTFLLEGQKLFGLEKRIAPVPPVNSHVFYDKMGESNVR